MSIKTEHSDSNIFYFCTFTCNRWLNLFSITDSFDLVYKWFNIIAALEYKISGYVIMPNHVHSIIYCPENENLLNKRVGNGKRFMAYEIVSRLEQQNENKILELMETDVSPSDRKTGKLHQVFIDSFDARVILSEAMMIQKLDYIHHNPVRGKWSLVKDFVDYPHSSAKFYQTGLQGIFQVTHFRDLW